MHISNENIKKAKEIVNKETFEQDDGWQFIAEVLQQAQKDTQIAINHAISGGLTAKEMKLLISLDKTK